MIAHTEATRRPSPVVRRAWFASLTLLWTLAVVHAIRGGFQPGLRVPSETGLPFPYPWLPVFTTCVITALQLAGLGLILRPGTWPWSPLRVAAAAVASALILAFELLSVGTDYPGYVYAPGALALLTTGLLFLIWCVTLAVTFRRHRRRPSPSSPDHAA
jgi:hypothetical protein